MCGWECGGCWRGYCREIRGARRALHRCVLEGASTDGLYPSPRCTSSAPMSTACFSFSFSLPWGPRTVRPLKAALKPSTESSPSPLKGTEGTGSSGSGSPAGFGAGAGFAGATESAVVSAMSLVSILYSFALQWSQSQRTRCTARGCRYAKSEILCYQKVKTGFHSRINFVSPISPRKMKETPKGGLNRDRGKM